MDRSRLTSKLHLAASSATARHCRQISLLEYSHSTQLAFTRTGYGPFGDGTRVYLSRTRTAARHCRDLTGTPRTHVAVSPSNSGSVNVLGREVYTQLQLRAGLDAGRQGKMDGCCRGVPAALQPRCRRAPTARA
eukprot:3894874-Prymnesium_polylepis.1